MPFCTKCGANVTGTFCTQCGTPAAGAAASAPPTPPPAMAAPYAQPYQPPVAPGAPVVVVRKTSPIVWVLVIVLGLFVLGGISVAAFLGYVAHRVHQAVSIDNGRDGGFTMHTRGADGKNATIEFGGTGGKLPSWVPVYPGSDGRAKFAMRGSADGQKEAGSFVFTTTDDVARVKSFYTDKCRDLGMKVNLDTTTVDGGMIVAVEEGAEERSLMVTVGGHSGETTVNVTYGRK
jgi:hypothetical protein